MKEIWKEYNGLDITVDEYGKFATTIGDLHLHDSTWDRLRLRIESETKAEVKAIKLALDCVVLLGNDDTDYSVQRVTVTGLSRKDSSFKFQQTGVDSKYVQYLLPYTPKNLSLLEELATAKATARDIQLSIKDRVIHQDRWGGRIEPTKYPEILTRLKDSFIASLKDQSNTA